MLRYNTMATDGDDIKLSVGIDEFDKYYMPSLEFCNVEPKNYPGQTEIWDNEDYIWGKFYKFLKRFDESRLKKKDKEKFANIWSELNANIVKELIEMLDKGIELGWYTHETERT